MVPAIRGVPIGDCADLHVGGDVMDADSLLDAYDDARADRDIQARYALAIALWDEAHQRNRRGYLPEQRLRWCQFIDAVNGQFSLEHAAFARWLVDNGRLTR
jgi:hypothetical protein